MTVSWACSDDFELTAAGACGAPTLRPSPSLEQRLALDLSDPPSSPPQMQLGVHLHAFYPEETRRILALLHNSLPSCDLLITTDTITKQYEIHQFLAELTSPPWQERVEVRVVPNRGRNILPLLRDGVSQFRQHQLLLHLHTKRTAHHDFGSDWLANLLDCLAGSPGRVRALMQAFEREPRLGLVMPQPSDLIRPFVHWGANFEVATLLVHTLWSGRKLDVQAPLVFPPGMMFWARPAALLPLADAIAALEPLPLEPLLHDGTPLHALERLTAHACEVAGLHWALVAAASQPEATQAASGHPARQQLSVWEAQPEAYLEGVAGLAKRHRLLHERLDERDRQLKAISDHRDSLEQSLAERDRGLAERDTALEASRRDLMAAITEHRNSLETLLAERDRGLAEHRSTLAEHRSTLEASRLELLAAIEEHQKSLEISLAERESALKSQLTDFQEKQQDLKTQLHTMVAQLEKLLDSKTTLAAHSQQLLHNQRDLQNSLTRWEQALARRDSTFLQSCQELISTQRNHWQQLQAILEQGIRLEASMSDCTTIVGNLESERLAMRATTTWKLRNALRRAKRKLTQSWGAS